MKTNSGGPCQPDIAHQHPCHPSLRGEWGPPAYHHLDEECRANLGATIRPEDHNQWHWVVENRESEGGGHRTVHVHSVLRERGDLLVSFHLGGGPQEPQHHFPPDPRPGHLPLAPDQCEDCGPRVDNGDNLMEEEHLRGNLPSHWVHHRVLLC